ncbi:MAG TPA: competence/damage-inducible protein A [Clostridia bacterium]|nr:competence/damage-inducible protein A [Clostridia bacterium]
MPVCEIISVGTELLLGEILNTNARFLSLELAALGISVLRQTTVGDNPDRLAQAFKDALSRSDIVIASGGLGPTADDITKEVCCRVMGFELVVDEEILAFLENFFASRNIKMPQSNKKQALVPLGGTIFNNKNGTAPGIACEKDSKCIILLPGPPRELNPMFLESVKPFLSKYADEVILSHTIRTFGIGESAMAELAEDLLCNKNPTVAPYAKDGEALLRVTACAQTNAKAQALCTPVIESLLKRLNPYVYGVDVDSLQQKVVELLTQKNLKVALAESCTGGYTAKRLTEVAGASKVFECGIITYSNEMKIKLLNVSPDTLKEHGAVSEQTVVEMAKGARAAGNADIGVGITGIAGPQGDGSKTPAGLSFIALADKDSVRVEKIQTGKPFEREYNRYYTASRALNMIRLYAVDY